MSAEQPGERDQLRSLQQRLDLLERENQRLREKLDPIVGPDNPCFDPAVFRRVLATPMPVIPLSPKPQP